MINDVYKKCPVEKNSIEWYKAELENKSSYIKDLRKQVQWLQEELKTMSKYYYKCKELNITIEEE